MTDAKEYGRALFELAEEAGRTEAIIEDLKTVNLAFTQNPKYKTLLDTPALPKDERLALIDKAFAGADEYVLNVIKMLCENDVTPYNLYDIVLDKTDDGYFEAEAKKADVSA